jgi:hypothetical protein
MTKTEQTAFINGIIADSIRDIKEGFATRLEALNYVRGYILAATVLGFMADAEQKKIISDFKSKLDEIKKQKEGKE